MDEQISELVKRLEASGYQWRDVSKDSPITTDHLTKGITDYESGLIGILVTIETLNSLIYLPHNGSLQDDEYRAITGDISRVRALVDDLSSDFDKLSSYHRVEGLDALSKRVNIRSDDASAAINSLERAYEALKALRDLLQKASHEEGLAKLRISTEMSELTAESKHITEELRFIQAEKEKIAAKAINEFQPIPFPELIDHEVGFTNVSWKEMYNRATYDNIYN